MENKKNILQIRKRYYGIKSRCYNKNCPNYKDYGGRNIKMCDEWYNNINAFIKWSLKNGFSSELSIDRINVNGNYEPNNCRWTTRKIQARNKRKIVNNENVIHSQSNNKLVILAEKTNMSIITIYKRLKELGRLPTEEECQRKKCGRPRKYNY